jgi:hypothetical protein
MASDDIQEMHQQKNTIIGLQVADSNCFLIPSEKKMLTDYAGVV